MQGINDTGRSAENEKVITTVCHDHCTSAYLPKLHISEGKIRRAETDDSREPRYRPCARGRAYRQYVHAPNRSKYPLRRADERGEGKLERIAWDEAFGSIASQLKRIRAQ